MSRFRQVFSGRHVVLPVIHVQSLEQTLRNTEIARDAGADGVFLINHGMADEALLDIHDSVADDHPGWWVGVNCLGLSPEQVFSRVSPKVSGVWADNAGIDEAREEQPHAERVSAARRSRNLDALYFGGVAFKYQRRVDRLEVACRVAAGYMDVVTTSGPGTGQAAGLEKIRRMKLALGDTPLAIASGITPENVADYLPCADVFLVATGISRSFTELDPARVRALVQRARSQATEPEPKLEMRPAIERRHGPHSSAIRLVDISEGAEFELDLTQFAEEEPVFAYVDDDGSRVLPLRGLALDGEITLEAQPQLTWLGRTRSCAVLRARRDRRQGNIASFLSRAAGEFWLEVYHLRPGEAPELLYRGDFCFK